MARMRVRLTFPSALIQEPIVYRLVKDFDIVINIRRADVKADHGWMVLELEGDERVLERGVIPRDESIVICVTGNGLKTPDSLQERLDVHVKIKPSLSAFDRALADLKSQTS